MSILQSLGQKKRWVKVSKKKRSKTMSKVALEKWRKISARDRSAHAKMMANAKMLKKVDF